MLTLQKKREKERENGVCDEYINIIFFNKIKKKLKGKNIFFFFNLLH